MILYPWGFQVPDLAKFTGDDAKTTYEHIGQFLAQVNNVGITDMHNIRMFPLSLTGAVRTKTLMAWVELGRTLSRKVNPNAFLFKATKVNKTTK
jgi:hypothetical protein